MPCAGASRLSSDRCSARLAARRWKLCLAGVNSERSGLRAGIAGLILLLVTALGVVVQVKDAMNTIWNVEDPREADFWWYLRTHLISFAGILALGFLLVTSLAISTALAALSSWAGLAS